MSVGAGGLHGVSGGADGALRLWARSDEPLVLGDDDDENEGLATGDSRVSSEERAVVWRHCRLLSTFTQRSS